MEEEVMDRKELLFKKAKVFSKYLNKKIHISTNGKGIYNGYILKVNKDYISFEDQYDGKILLFFEEIENIEEFKERRTDGWKKKEG